VLRDLLKVGKLGDDTGNRGSRCREKRIERVKFGMARRLTYPIGCLVADPFKAFLFDKCGLVIAASFSVDFDQTKYRIWQGRGNGEARQGRNGLGDVRRPRGSGKGASTDGACDGGHGEETAPRGIAWREHHGMIDCRRVCGWRAKHAISLDHLGSQSFMARVRAGAEVLASPRLAFMIP